MTDNATQRIPPTAIIIFTFNVMVWGSSFILMKRGLVVFSPIEVALLRVVIAGLCLAPFALRAIGRARGKLPFAKLALTSLTGTAIPSFLFPYAQQELPSGTVGVLNSTTPLFAFILGLVFFGLQFQWDKLAGLLIGLAGAVALILLKPGEAGGASPRLDPNFLYGILPVIATISYAINANYVRYYLNHLSPLTASSVSLFIAVVPAMLPLLLFTDFLQHLQAPGGWAALGYVFLLGAIGTALTVALFYRLISLAGPLFATSVSYAIPIVALLWGVIDGEPLGWLHLIGLGLILAGVYLVGRRKAHHRPNRQKSSPSRVEEPA